MLLMVLGLNHKTAPVEVRERFAIKKDDIREGLGHLSEYDLLDEAVVISTCNRTELYAVVAEDAYSLPAVRQFLYDLAGNEADVSQYLYMYEKDDCIRHLLRVAASLDSLVIGEGQILSQVKAAYTLARKALATSTVLNLLFHCAIATGKRVRTETRIAFNAVSVSYAAVELVRKLFGGSLEKARVLIFGAGHMAELTARHLVARGVQKIYVANRHKDKAQQMAEYFHGEAVAFDKAFCQAVDIDIVVTSTGAPHYVVKPWETQQLMARRQYRQLVFIDIAVPRDVDPEVETIQGVRLYNIDDLEAVVDEHIAERRKEAELAERIIEEEAEEIINRYQYLSFQPLMARLSDRAESVRQREVRRALGKLPYMDEESQRILEHMSKMIVRKLLREPMMRLNASAGTPQEAFYIEAVRKLFKLDKLGEEAACERQNHYRDSQQ